MSFLKIGLFIVLLVAVGIFKQWGTTAVQPDPAIQSTTLPDGEIVASTAESQILQIDGQRVTSVVSLRNPQVIDGDSLRWNSITGPVEYRLASIDAPEFSQAFGQRAKSYLQSVIADKELTAYQTDTDRYGRRVAFLFANPPNRPNEAFEVNAQMVADGYAWHAIKHSSNTNLRNLESNARAGRMGLWEQPNPTAPWEFRDREQQQRTGSAKIGP